MAETIQEKLGLDALVKGMTTEEGRTHVICKAVHAGITDNPEHFEIAIKYYRVVGPLFTAINIARKAWDPEEDKGRFAELHEEDENYVLAARLHEELGDKERAGQLYLKAGDYEAAARLNPDLRDEDNLIAYYEGKCNFFEAKRIWERRIAEAEKEIRAVEGSLESLDELTAQKYDLTKVVLGDGSKQSYDVLRKAKTGLMHLYEKAGWLPGAAELAEELNLPLVAERYRQANNLGNDAAELREEMQKRPVLKVVSHTE